MIAEKIPNFDPDEMNSRQNKLFELLQFFTRLLAVGAVFHFLLWLYPDTTTYQDFLTQTLTWGLNLFGYEFTTSGFRIVTPGVDYLITQDCTGWKSGMALIGLVYASTGSLRNHLKFIGAGLAGIWLANYIRVMTTIILTEAGILSFDVVHGFLWRWGLTAFVFALWIIWYRGLQDSKDDKDSSSE